MKKFVLFYILSFFFIGTVFAQDGFKVRVKLDNFSESEIYLAYYYGDKQYIRDTVQLNNDGYFVFEGEEALPGGVYLVVMPPDNKFFQVLVNGKENKFDIHANAANPSTDIKFKGSKENELFYDYISYLNSKRPLADQLNKAIENAGDNEEEKQKLQEKLDKVNEEVKKFQSDFLRKNANSLTAAILKANQPLDMPEFEGDEKEISLKKWRYTLEHYFDHIDLSDPNLLRTPFLFQRINYFVNKLHVQHPDSLSLGIDYVLEKTRPAEETFKYYLIHFLNEYAKSKIVGMDAVYVHIVNKYYATGQAPWTDEEQLKKIIDNAQALEPLLIGKIAPDIRVQKRDGTRITLHEVDAPITILYFWRYDCGHCKESAPVMQEFYEKYKEKGVEIFSVCTKFTDEVAGCWKFIDEKEIGDWLHTVDPYNRSRFAQIYNIKTTPQLYVLDENKKILSKRIGAEQLEEVIDKILEMKSKE